MKAKQNPRQYALEDVRRLIREYRPCYRGECGTVYHEREHTAAKAWSEIVKGRTPEIVARLERILVRMANEPYTLACGEQWSDPSARKRLARTSEKFKSAAVDVEWVLSHPGPRFYRFTTTGSLRKTTTFLNKMAEAADRLRTLADLIHSYNHSPHGAARLRDFLANDSFLFVGVLKASGRVNLKEPVDVLKPIFEEIGAKPPTRGSLKRTFASHRRYWIDWMNSKDQRMA
jgi:hypothetical protein